IVILNHNLHISFRNRCSVRVHRVQKKLHRCCPASLKIARVRVWNHYPGVEIAAVYGFAELVCRKVVAGQLKALALRQVRNQLPAFRGLAVIDYSEPEVRYVGAQSESKE